MDSLPKQIKKRQLTGEKINFSIPKNTNNVNKIICNICKTNKTMTSICHFCKIASVNISTSAFWDWEDYIC